MFYGREAELDYLNKAYASNKFQFIPVYGRKRVGKTSLLQKFISDKPGIYFTPKFDFKSSLEHFSRLIYGQPRDCSATEMLEEIAGRAADSEYVLIVDEFPRLLREKTDLIETLQDFFRAHLEDSKLLVIVCGSSVDVMRKTFIDKDSPLCDRKTGMIHLAPFSPWDSFKVLHGFEKADAFRIWGMVGGMPYYLNAFDDRKSLEQNIAENFLRNGSIFEDECMLALSDNYDVPMSMQQMISAISTGNNRISDISKVCRKDSSQISTTIAYLCDSGIVDKLRPVDNPDGRTTKYMVSDHFLRFWMNRIEYYRDLAIMNDPEEVATKIISVFDSDMDMVFQEICGSYLRSTHHGTLGTWWGPDPSTRSREQVDIVLSTQKGDKNIGWFADCYYTDTPLGSEALEKLRYEASLVKGYDECRYVLFSKAGFKDDLLKETVELYTLDDVLNFANAEREPFDTDE